MLKKVLAASIAAILIASMASTVMAQVQVHGFLLARTVATPQNYAARIDRFGFQFAQTIDPEFDWLVETYIHPTLTTNVAGRLYLESAYLNWHLKERLPWDFNVRIGKGRNYSYGITPTYGNRHTSDYSLYSEAFTQVRVIGFQTFSNFGNFQIAASLLNPNILSTRQFPDFALDNSVFVPVSIADRDNDTGAIPRSAAFSGRLGYKTSILNVGGSAYISKYGPGTIGAVEVENSVTRFGLDGELKMENGILLQGQFTIAQTPVDLNGDALRETALDHNGFEVLGGYEKGQYGLIARYGVVNYDDEFQGLNQIMLSAVYKIRPTVHLRLEGLINGEQNDSGFAEVDNNVLFFETLFAW
ncbi:MAG: hypothetical protein ACYC9O_17745 [Candidatus Latescibacterota bacterium]